jgi:hypothetical protein
MEAFSFDNPMCNFNRAASVQRIRVFSEAEYDEAVRGVFKLLSKGLHESLMRTMGGKQHLASLDESSLPALRRNKSMSLEEGYSSLLCTPPPPTPPLPWKDRRKEGRKMRAGKEGRKEGEDRRGREGR